MKHVPLFYKHIYNIYRIIAKSYDMGLEFREGGFFYNPQTQDFDEYLRAEYIEKSQQRKKEITDVINDLANEDRPKIVKLINMLYLLVQNKIAVKEYEARQNEYFTKAQHQVKMLKANSPLT